MPRSVPQSFKTSFGSSSSPDLPVLFATLTHASFGVIRLNSDNVDYVYGGNTFTGVSLDVKLVTDDDQPPRATISMMNVNRVASDTLIGLTDSPVVKLELISSVDFNTSTPRSPLGTPTVLYTADNLRMANINGDVLTVTADLTGSLDPSSEPWPGITGTQARLPGLYR